MEKPAELLQIKQQIKAEALRLGFSACGMAQIEPVAEEARQHFDQWIHTQRHAEMDYMERHTELRMNPSLLLEGAQTLLSLAVNYYPPRFLPAQELQIAWYAYGKDYHEVVKERLRRLLLFIQGLLPVKGRVCVDTAPLLERYWAWKAGIGWIGKHTQLIIPGSGSCFFLGEILIEAHLPADLPLENRCGGCKQCIEACPSQALSAAFTLEAGKCLSYQSVEHRGPLSPEALHTMKNRMYGCDECQKACPHNRFAPPTLLSEFHLSEALSGMTRERWSRLTVEEYRALFKGSAVKRVKYEGLMRNIKGATESEQSPTTEERD